MRILGIDPGSRVTGYGLLEQRGSRLLHIDNGAIYARRDDDLALRLQTIYRGLCQVIENYAPETVAVEQIFVSKNVLSALKLGHARAIALLAAAQADLEIAEYAPNHIKKCVVGVGHAGKEQVQAMIRVLLPTARCEQADAADALAAAIAHAHLAGTRVRLAAAQ